VDYCAWDDDERWELIDGVPYLMTAPSITHQRILLELAGQFRDFLKGKPCEVFVAPLDVRLNALGDDDYDVFQPDILVVCDETKLDERGCNGAPDMVIEVISSSTAKYDRVYKFRKYQMAGVKEYWIADPKIKTVQANILENGHYITNMYEAGEKAPVSVLEGCKIDLTTVFS
jgi:Uma2 family endonuclease